MTQRPRFRAGPRGPQGRPPAEQRRRARLASGASIVVAATLLGAMPGCDESALLGADPSTPAPAANPDAGAQRDGAPRPGDPPPDASVGRSSITATQVGMLDFAADQRLTRDEMTGVVDVTAKLQAAVDAARKSYRALFIPSGRYLVSDTIRCVLDEAASPDQPTHLIGSAIQHPVLVLADRTPAFMGKTPKAVVTYGTTNASHGTDWVMEGGIRGIDFDLGAGNTGAVAVYWGSAQYTYIEDIHVEARDGFAGATGIGGANALFSGVSVNGGKHGLYLPNSSVARGWGMPESPQNTIAGCTFTGQSEVPVVLWGWGGITMVGTTIVAATKVAIQMDTSSYAAVIQFPFSLVDSRIEFSRPDAANHAIENGGHGTVSLRGVYVKGAGTVSYNAGDEDLAAAAPPAEWTRVSRYNYVDKKPRNDSKGGLYPGEHYDAVTGGVSTAAIVDTSRAAPPVDLTSRHLWATTPSFEDADAVLVTTAAELQSAVDSHRKVCLAKGKYELKAPLILRAETVLVGAPGRGVTGSVLTYGFTPTVHTWLIDTDDDAGATTYLMDITTDPANANYLGSLRWRAGRASVVRDVWFDMSWDEHEADLVRFLVTGNGGGRVFNYQDEKGASGRLDPNHRKVKVAGTTQPLVFYGLNLERGGSKYPVSTHPMLEISDAANVRVFGAKSETFQPYARITNSHDIFLTNVIDYTANGAGTTNSNYIEIAGSSDNIEIANALFLSPPSAAYLIVSDPWNTNGPSRTTHVGLYHRHFTSF